MMHSINHMFNTSVIPYISIDQYLTPNLYTIPNMQIMRFFCCSAYDSLMKIVLRTGASLLLRVPFDLSAVCDWCISWSYSFTLSIVIV